MTTPAHDPPLAPSNEASEEELVVALEEGDAYAAALKAMADEDGAVTRRAGDYLVAFVNEEAEGMYMLEDGDLVWREAADDANVHLEVAVADAADGRFVPGLSIQVEVTRGGETFVSTELPFLWHPFLYHYGSNARVPDEGPFDVRVRVGAPTFMRHDPINGKRYAGDVVVEFSGVRFANGRKESPEAAPRGEPAPTAGV